MNYNVNINRLRYFQKVCAYSNITKAAVSLNISQPSVTAAIKELEEELGVKLFFRQKNRLKLTAEGAVILEKTNALLGKIDEFFKEVKELGQNAAVNVRLGVPPIIGTVFIPKIYAAFSEVHPEISLQIFECTTSDAAAHLENNYLDICIMLEKSLSEGFDYKIIYQTELLFCVSRENALAEKKKLTCRDLETFPLAILSNGSFHHAAVIDLFAGKGLTPNIVLRSLELYTITQLVENFDIGTFTYRDIFQDNPKIAMLPCEAPIPATLFAAWNKNSYLTKSAEKVIRFLASQQWRL